jgi:polysaccharide export outer membrane protein
MRRSFLFESVTVIVGGLLWTCAAQAQSAPPAQPPKGVVPSLSPAMPVTDAPADPAKIAAPLAGGPPAGVPVPNTFRLGVEDQVQVSMWDDHRFDGSYLILPNGMISLPLINEVKAAGLTPLELQDAIDKAALVVMRNPRSHVAVTGVHSHRIYFDGEGIAAGQMENVIPIHLFDAISAHGGFKDFADTKHIRIMRDGKPLLVVNYKDLLNGKHPEKNILLQDGDHIIVK